MYSRFLLTLLAVLAASAILAPASFAASAKDNYGFYCAQCHGLDGRGDGPNATKNQPVEPRDHTSAYEMEKLTDAEIIDSITGGGAAVSKSTLMPPFGKTLTTEEIAALKDYLRKMCDCKGK